MFPVKQFKNLWFLANIILGNSISLYILYSIIIYIIERYICLGTNISLVHDFPEEGWAKYLLFL